LSREVFKEQGEYIEERENKSALSEDLYYINGLELNQYVYATESYMRYSKLYISPREGRTVDY